MKPAHDDRPYQREMEEAAINFLVNETGNGLIVAPGGSGKSFVMSRIMKRLIMEWPGTRIVLLAQDAKLLSQNCNELLRYWPGAPVGIYSSGLKQRDTTQQIIFAGIQSAAKCPEAFGKRHIFLIDEADQVSDKEQTLYQKFLNYHKELNPLSRALGFTATCYRLGVGCLTNMEMWDRILIDLTKTERFQWFIDHGFLAPLINKKGAKEIDITQIGMVGGDFNEKEMQAIADTDEMNKAVVNESIRYGHDRKHWLVFSSGVEHGHKLAKLFNSRGIPAVMLSGKDSMEVRDDAEKQFRSGEVRVLINCGLFGRGWDFTPLDLVVWARATQSTALWIQGCVRGTRIAEGKTNCLILDMAGNTRRLGPINAPIVPTPRRKGQASPGDAPLKICNNCMSYRPIQERVCADCGTEFPITSKVQKNASSDAIMAGPVGIAQVEDFYVRGIRYAVGQKTHRYLKVTHMVGTQKYSEYKFFEHSNAHILKLLSSWWTHRGGLLPLPETCDEALERAANELKIPTVIRIDISGDFPQIVGCDFDEDAKISNDENPFDPEKCTCSNPGLHAPCGYCESGDYDPF